MVDAMMAPPIYQIIFNVLRFVSSKKIGHLSKQDGDGDDGLVDV